MSWGSFFKKSTSTAYGLWSHGEGTASHHHQRLFSTGLLCKLESCHHPLLLHTFFSWMLRLSLHSTWSWFQQINPAWVLATEGTHNSKFIFHNTAEITQDMHYSTRTKKSSLANVSAGLEVQVSLGSGHLNHPSAFWVYQARAQFSPWGMEILWFPNITKVTQTHQNHSKLLKSCHANRC